MSVSLIGSKARSRAKRLALVAGIAALLASAVAAGPAAAGNGIKVAGPKPKAKNVIVMISDGMGYNQVAAANYYQFGRSVGQPYERFPVKLAMSTYSVNGTYDPLAAWASFGYVKTMATDSAAAATAMSTGVKTYDAGIGVDAAGTPLYHVAQHAEKLGKATGVVSSVQLSHATPAGFVAHNAHRNNYSAIAQQMIGSSATEVIMGAGHPMYDNDGKLRSTPDYRFVGGQAMWDGLVAGTVGGDADGDGVADTWALIQDEEEFAKLAVAKTTPNRVLGVPKVHSTLQQSRSGDDKAAAYTVPFNAGVPDLPTMSKAALNVLDDNRRGFFLMIEGGAPDWAGHANQAGRLIEEQADFNKSVKAVMRWVQRNSNWSETLLIVTGDHETGYLTGPGSDPGWTPLVNNGAGQMPGTQFNSGDHTNSLIPLFARGAGAQQLRSYVHGVDPVRGSYLDNTACAHIAFKLMK